MSYTPNKSAYPVGSISNYGLPEAQCTINEIGGEATLSGANYTSQKSPSRKPGHYDYRVQITAGKQVSDEARNYTYMTLVGSKGHTGKISLARSSKSPSAITKETTENWLVVTNQDLGDILVVIVGNSVDTSSQWMEDTWYVSFVGVANPQTNTVEHFPCYHWIGENSSVSITAKTTTLKDVRNEKVLMRQRSEQLKQRQELYQWQKFPEIGIPSGILDTGAQEELPADEQFGKVKDATASGVGGFIGKSFQIAIDDLHDFEKIGNALGQCERPLYQAGRWTTDVEFGRQMLNGVNPIIIEKCVTVPSNFPVTNDMVKPFLVRGLSLEEEIKCGHFYICDMKIMDGLEAREGYYNVAPICLLYVNGSGQLVPIAIQLKQGVKEEEKENNPIFLPSDNWIDWLVAKIYYRSAHSQDEM